MKKGFTMFILCVLFIFQSMLLGFGDSSNKVPESILAEWDNVTPKGNYYVVFKDYKYGLLDKLGNIVLKPEYKNLFWLSDSALIGQRTGAGGKHEFVDINGKVLFTLPSDYIVSGYCKGTSVVRVPGQILRGGEFVPGRIGVIDTNGKFVIPLGKYEGIAPSADWNTNAYYVLKKVNGKLKGGFIDGSEKIIIPFQFDGIERYEDENIPTNEKSYEDMSKYFCGNLAVVKKNNKWGCIDKTGKTVIPFEYDKINMYNNGFLIVVKNGKYGVIDNSGKVIMPCKYNSIEASVIEYAIKSKVIKVDNKFAVVSEDGKFPSEIVWEDLGGFHEGIAWIYQNGMYGFADNTGKVLFAPQWDYAFDFNDGLAVVQKGGKYGLVDNKGNVVSEPQWDWIDSFRNGYARVQKGSMSGFIDKKGQVVLSTDMVNDKLANLFVTPGAQIKFMDDFTGDSATLMAAGASYRVDKSGKKN